MVASSLGERRIIDIILESLDVMPSMPVSFGDDVSAVEIDDERLAILKTDMLVGETDVPSGMSYRQAARKSVVMNISDMAAKGVKPIAILSSIGLPRGMGEEDVREIGLGLNDGAREYGAYIIGGDTNEAPDLVISCSVLGFCRREEFIGRDGARPGDILAVTGLFGKTSSGLKILMENLKAPDDIRDVLVKSVLLPEARLAEGLALASSGAATSSIDSSDGLAWSLYELSRMSGVGFIIDYVPVAPEAIRFAEANSLDPEELALYGGEEYELIVTIKPDLWDAAERAVGEAGSSLIRIGRVISERKILLRRAERLEPIEARGWEHFRR